jgi:hypothetical protein
VFTREAPGLDLGDQPVIHGGQAAIARLQLAQQSEHVVTGQGAQVEDL